MIERGLRTPSAEVVLLLSKKLGENLFDYYEYLDCQDPVYTRNLIRRLDSCRHSAYSRNLQSLLHEASECPDFRKEPFVYELKMNQLFHYVTDKREFEQSIERINATIQQIPPKYDSAFFSIELYLLLHVCYNAIEQKDAARNALDVATSLLKTQSSGTRFNEVYLVVQLNWIVFCFSNNSYKTALDASIDLYDFQQRSRLYTRLGATCMFAAFSYYRLDQVENAYYWFRKALYALMTTGGREISLVSIHEEFWIMLSDVRCPREIVQDLFSYFPEPVNSYLNSELLRPIIL
jgi:tetratricopeptide (TPR) repeat protein